MVELSTPDINRMLHALIPNTVTVLGTFPADKVPQGLTTRQTPCCFVLNTHPNGLPGEHWLAFYYDGRRVIEYFDSYGLPLETHASVHAALVAQGLVSLCKSANTIALQSPITSVCGQYCVLFLFWRSKHPFAPIKQFSAWVVTCGGVVAVQRDIFVARQLSKLVARSTSSSSANRVVPPCSVQTCHCRCI